MKVIVDTCIWSLALRRRGYQESRETQELRELIQSSRVQMIGPIRQELLSGLRAKKDFKRLRQYLTAFPDLPLTVADYEKAAEFFNIARAKGVQGSNTDFLICSVSHIHEMPIFTVDQDFEQFAKLLPISLYRL